MRGEIPSSYTELVCSDQFNGDASVADDKTWTLSRVLAITGLAATNCFCYTSVFILSSFFPPLAEGKQISGMELGLIIGIIQGIFAVFAYSFILITHIFPPKTQVLCGLTITGLCTITFGFLNQLPDGELFFGACFFVRIIQGIGIAASDVSVLVIANQIIPHNFLGTVIGILEFSLAAAIALSPAIGGYLYEIGGFYLPFLVSGVTTLLCAVYCVFVLPVSGSIGRQPLRKILQRSVSFEMLVFIIQFMLGGGFSGFFAGIIEPHLRKFNLSPGQVGLVILITNAVSGIMFPIFGYVTDKLKNPSIVTFFGCSLTAVGFLLFGPFPYLPVDSNLPLVCSSLVLCGFGIAAVLISTYTAAQEHLKHTCENDDLANAVLSTSYPSTYNIGAFLGAILGGIFVQYIGYRNGSAILFALQLFGIFLQIIFVARRRCSKHSQ